MRKDWQGRGRPRAERNGKKQIDQPPNHFRGRQEMRTTERSKADPPIFVGKWTVQILFGLHKSPHRHGQLQRQLRGVSQRMLTRTLRNLESTGLVARNLTGSNDRGVEYSLTELGRTFIAPLTSVCQWARQNRKDISAEIRLTETHLAQ